MEFSIPNTLVSYSRLDSDIPPRYSCPLSGKLMTDPVDTDSGITYDRNSIEKWLSNGNTLCFVTGKQISHNLRPNTELARQIVEWRRNFPELGDASQNQFKVLLKTLKTTQKTSLDGDSIITLRRVRKLLKKEGWTPQKVQKFRPGDILADKLAYFGSFINRNETALDVLEEIIITFKFVIIDISTLKKLAHPTSLYAIVLVLNRGGTKGQIGALHLIADLLTLEDFVDQVGSAEGLIKGLLHLVQSKSIDGDVKACTLMVLRLLAGRTWIKRKLNVAGAKTIVEKMLAEYSNVDDLSNECTKLLQIL